MQNDNPAQAALHAAYQKYAASSPLDADSTTTWAAGKMLELAFQKMGPAAQQQPVTKQMVLSALAQVKNETLGGLIPPTSYAAGQPSPENFCFYPMQFGQNGAFTAPNGSQYQCIQ
jgi:branched-chain amino acid transport system substrate-binding protein